MADTTSSAFNSWKPYVLLAAIVLIAVIPFSSRAVFMDEHIFLKLAQSAQTQWLFPQDTPGIFFGREIPDFASHTHPPVGEYFLALIYAAVGRFEEVPFRLSFGIFALLALMSFYSLARRFVAEPLIVAALFGLSPAFFVYAPTLMMDMPMLAFLLAGFALYFRAIDGSRWALPAVALFLALAAGTGYTAMIPISCLFVFMLAARRPGTELLAVAAAPAALSLWLTAMTVHFGRFPLIDTALYFAGQGSVWWNVAAVFTFLGGVTVFPLAAAGKRFRPIPIVIGAALLSLLIPKVGAPVWLATLALAGAVFVALFLISARRLLAAGSNRGEAFLLLWAPTTLGFFVVVGDMINARYILLAAPALFLIVFRETPRPLLMGMLLPTALLSLAVAHADAIFLNSNRELVEREIAPLQAQGHLLFGGAESGLRFYLEQRGVPTLSSKDATIKSGDLVVRHSGFPFRYSLPPDTERKLAPHKRFILQSFFPIRTFNSASHAGFHDSRLGLSPFTASAAPFDGIQIEETNPASISPSTSAD